MFLWEWRGRHKAHFYARIFPILIKYKMSRRFLILKKIFFSWSFLMFLADKIQTGLFIAISALWVYHIYISRNYFYFFICKILHVIHICGTNRGERHFACNKLAKSVSNQEKCDFCFYRDCNIGKYRGVTCFLPSAIAAVFANSSTGYSGESHFRLD